MNQKSNHFPEPEEFEELDELDGLPTYQGPTKRTRPARTAPPPGPSIYELAGRAAPQSIPPAAPTPATPPAPETSQPTAPPTGAATSTPEPAAQGPQTAPVPPAASAPTPADADLPTQRSRPLLSDAPTTMHDPVAPQPLNEEAATSTLLEQGFAAPQVPPLPPEPVAAPAPSDFPAPFDFDEDASEHEDLIAVARRGTLDFGLLIVRVILGAFFVGDALTTFFLWGGSTGIAGLEGSFALYNQPHLLAIVYPALELVAGVFLLLGLIQPVAGMVAVAASGFLVLHEVAQSHSLTHSLVLALMLLGLSAATTFTGPGRYSFDRGRTWTERPLLSSWLAVVIGVAAVGVIWWLLAGVSPLAARG